MISCDLCGYPSRRVWPPSSKCPKFQQVESKNWMTLAACPSCDVRWVGVGWEPYASFEYWVPWEHSDNQWNAEIDDGEGRRIHKWHHEQLKTNEDTLTAEDLADVAVHRARNYGRDPFNAI